MHDPEKFQQEMIKAVKDLQEVYRSNHAQYLALSAVVKAFLAQIPLPALQQIRENFVSEVDSQAVQQAAHLQRREHWDDWEAILDALVQREATRPGGPRAS